MDNTKLSEIASDIWYETITDCINHNQKNCDTAAGIFQNDWEKHDTGKSFWQNQEETLKSLLNDEQEYKEALSIRHNVVPNEQKAAINKSHLFAYIKGYVKGYLLAKKRNK
ncbi:MAG TPA: hypothetical protein VL201_03320 [Patescibacteria group bacterium]|jgi:hypothetical protein|nr:hypothetical protein [Patescibacteria group bacterium]